MMFETESILSPSNCPLFNGSGMCMCASMACDDVKDFHCVSMRAAYIYGFNTMAQSASEKVNVLTEKVIGILHNDGGVQDG